MQTIIIVAEFFTFIVTGLFGVYVFSRNPWDRIHQAFGLTMLGISGWTLCIFLLLAGIGPIEIPGRLAFSFATILMTGLGLFTAAFPTPVRFKNFWVGFYALTGIAFTVVPVLPSFVQNIRLIGGSISGDLSPTLFPLWSLYYSAILVVNLLFLAARTLAAHGVERYRLRQLLFGFLLFLSTHITTNVLLPLFAQDFRWNNFGPIFIFLLLPFMATAVMRYRLLDIRWIVSKSVIVSTVSVFIIWIVLSSSFFLAELITTEKALMLGSIVASLVIVPAARMIERAVNALFKRGRYDREEFLNQVFTVVRTELEITKIQEQVLPIVTKAFGAEYGRFITFAQKSTSIIAQTIIGAGNDREHLTPKILALIKANPGKIIEINELSWNALYGEQTRTTVAQKTMLNELKNHGVDAIIPLVMNAALVGYIAIGRRKYDRVLSVSDINTLELFRAGIAPAVDNAIKFAQMRELYERLKEADLLKSQFVDVVSHQFRTPLSSIRWNVEVLLEEKLRLNKAATGMLTEVQTNANFLINTLGLLVDVIELESTAAEHALSREQVDATEFLPLIESFKSQAAHKNIAISADIQPMTLRAEKRLVEQALRQLLINAIEYTPEQGTIRVAIKPDKGHAVISVTDTGIGMTPVDVKKRAFVKLYRGKNAVQLHPDGIGLGLYLVKLIATKSGGSVSLESVLAKGTTVKMLIPTVKSTAHSA